MPREVAVGSIYGLNPFSSSPVSGRGSGSQMPLRCLSLTDKSIGLFGLLDDEEQALAL
jgi:hypothetical protein